MKSNINANLIRIIKYLYTKATRTVYHNNEEWFRTTSGVYQGCLLSPTLFNILEKIMADALEDHGGTVSIGGRAITNLRFADEIRTNWSRTRAGQLGSPS